MLALVWTNSRLRQTEILSSVNTQYDVLVRRPRACESCATLVLLRCQAYTPRLGKAVEINHQPVEFSFWPVVKTTRRYGFQSRIFTSNPWAVIEESIAQKCPKTLRLTAHAFRDQAQDFFEMGQASKLPYAKPLPFYYSWRAAHLVFERERRSGTY
jgi:hypothetical protein